MISLNDHISKVDLSENKISTNYLRNSQTTTIVKRGIYKISYVTDISFLWIQEL